jgi:predicted metal-binding membrane protein
MCHVHAGWRRIVAALRWRPDWPFAVIAAAAWIALLTGFSSHAEHSHPSQIVTTVESQAHDHHHSDGPATPSVSPGDENGNGPESLGLPDVLLDWTVMSVAMMIPVALPALRHVGLNSIRSRRRWAMLVFFAVYVAIWVVFGVTASTVGGLVRKAFDIDNRTLLAVLLAVAACWQLTRTKRRTLNRCRRTVPLPPVGRRADAACARFAFQQGIRCLTSCWPLMGVMIAIQESAVVWMLGLTILIAAEELTRFGRHLLRWTAFSLSVVGGLVALGV